MGCILRKHDNRVDKEVSLGNTIVHTLGYADDAALIDYGHPEGVETASSRVSAIAAGSKNDADMYISIAKTKAMHVRIQDKVTETTEAEAKAICKYVCPNYCCKHTFLTRRGMLVHAGKCKWKHVYEVDRLYEHEGDTMNRTYKVSWEGYPPEEDQILKRSKIHPDIVKEYEIANGAYDHAWRFRCDICDTPCNSQHGIKIHKALVHDAGKWDNDKQVFKHRLADEAVKVEK